MGADEERTLRALQEYFGGGAARTLFEGACNVKYRIRDRRDYEPGMDILKKRYAKGTITKEKFEKMKKDILD